MEAVPKISMLSFELKISPENTSFGPKLKQYIADAYREEPESYSNEIHQLECLRSVAVRPTLDSTGLNAIIRYFCQLRAMQSRFPMAKGQPAAVPFVWKDIYANMNCTLANIRYEMACILYNIAALHTQLATAELRNNSDSLKVACTYLQKASWAFQHLKDNYPQPPGVDISQEIMRFFQEISFAQAQECILEKSIQDTKKPVIIGAIATQVLHFYRNCLALLGQSSGQDNIHETVGTKQYNHWYRYLSFKESYIGCLVYLYQGMQAEEHQKMGERVAFYQLALDKLNSAKKLAKYIEPTEATLEALTFTNDVVEGKRKAAKNENEFIYHEEVPDKDLLIEMKPVCLIKSVPINFNDPELLGADIFARLVPIGAHEASSVYSEQKAKVLRHVLSLVEAKDTELTEFMSSLQIDQLNVVNSDQRVPQEIVDRCAAMNAKTDIIETLSESMNSLAEIISDVEQSLDEIKCLIQEEGAKEKEYQKVMGVRPPSIVQTELARELNKYREVHSRTQESNQVLHKAMTLHISNLKLLSLPLDELQSKIPSIDQIEGLDRETMDEMRRIVGKTREMQAQRESLVQQLREDINNDDITAQLLARSTEPANEIFKTEMEKHTPKIKIIEQNLAAQENIINKLTSVYASYAESRRQLTEVLRKREGLINALVTSYDSHAELLGKAQKGREFYRRLAASVAALQARVRSVCQVQHEERQHHLANTSQSASTSTAVSTTTKATSGNVVAPTSTSSTLKLKDYLPYMKNRGLPRSVTPVQPESLPSDSYYPENVYPTSVRPAPVGSEATIDPAQMKYTDGYASTNPTINPYNQYGNTEYPYSATSNYQAYNKPGGGFDQSQFKTSTSENNNFYNSTLNSSVLNPYSMQQQENTTYIADAQVPQNINMYNTLHMPDVPETQLPPIQQPVHLPSETELSSSFAQLQMPKSETNYETPVHSTSMNYSTDYQNYYVQSTPAAFSMGLNNPYAGQNVPNMGQNVPNMGQNVMNMGQNNTNVGQPITNMGQNVTNIGVNAGQKISNVPVDYTIGPQNIAMGPQNIAVGPTGLPTDYNTRESTPNVAFDMGQNISNIPLDYNAENAATSNVAYNVGQNIPNVPSIPSDYNATNYQYGHYDTTSQGYQSMQDPALNTSTSNIGTSAYSYGNTSIYDGINQSYSAYTIANSGTPSLSTGGVDPTVPNQAISNHTYSGYSITNPEPEKSVSDITLTDIDRMDKPIKSHVTGEAVTADINAFKMYQPYDANIVSSVATYPNTEQTPHNYQYNPTNVSYMQQYQNHPGYTFNMVSGNYEYNYGSQNLNTNQNWSQDGLYTTAGTTHKYETLQSPLENQQVPEVNDEASNKQTYYNSPYGYQTNQTVPDVNIAPETTNYTNNLNQSTYMQSGQSVNTSVTYSNNQVTTPKQNIQEQSDYNEKITSPTYDVNAITVEEQSQVPQQVPNVENIPETGNQKVPEIDKQATKPVENKVLSSFDLLSDIDFSVVQKPLMPEIKVPQISESSIKKFTPPTVEPKKVALIVDDVIERPAKRDIFTDPSVLNKFTQEVKNLQLLVDSLTSKSASGLTVLGNKWKSLQELQAKELTSRRKASAARDSSVQSVIDVVPFDDSRLTLKSNPDAYINASYYKQLAPWCIPLVISKLPSETDCEIFWRAVLENNISCIICLLSEIEMQGNSYWPTAKGQTLELSGIRVTLEDVTCTIHWTERKITVTEGKTVLNVVHYQISVFPAKIVCPPLVLLADKILSATYDNKLSNQLSSAWIHCSQGAGRSSVVTLLLMAMCQVRAGQIDLCDMLDAACDNLYRHRTNVLEDSKYLVDAYKTVIFYVHGVLCSGTTLFNGESVTGPVGASMLPPTTPTPSTLDAHHKAFNKFSKESFEEMKQSQGLKSGDMKDPLNFLDPLWSLKKK